jgi:hypothetical protein
MWTVATVGVGVVVVPGISRADTTHAIAAGPPAK